MVNSKNFNYHEYGYLNILYHFVPLKIDCIEGARHFCVYFKLFVNQIKAS